MQMFWCTINPLGPRVAHVGALVGVGILGA
jgi:hypothetical protein